MSSFPITWILSTKNPLTLILLQCTFVQLQIQTCNYLTHLCPLNLFNGLSTHPNYASLKTIQLIQLHGYPAEEHFVTTDDGYVLSAQRIPYSSKSPLSSKPKIPVFLMHGTFASSAQWFWQPPNRALIFMLADAGYDVWLGNARGTSYSRGYVGPSPDSYWDFTFHEIGKYDLPAFINHIKQITKLPSLYYIGHSLGTNELFVFASTRPEMQSSIRTFFALSPTPFIGNTTNLFFRIIAPIFSSYFSEQTTVLLTAGPIIPQVIQDHLVDLTSYCAISAVECTACTIGVLAIFGVNPCLTNWTSFPGYLAHIPDSISGKTFSHEAQLVQYGTFRQYDYGFFHNFAKYGSFTPPDYKFDTYRIPTVFVVSDTDAIATPRDVQKSSNALGKSLKETIKVQYKPFYHLDYVIASDADTLLYNRIIEIMNRRLYG